jgi:hypothetical protein
MSRIDMLRSDAFVSLAPDLGTSQLAGACHTRRLDGARPRAQRRRHSARRCSDHVRAALRRSRITAAGVSSTGTRQHPWSSRFRAATPSKHCGTSNGSCSFATPGHPLRCRRGCCYGAARAGWRAATHRGSWDARLDPFGGPCPLPICRGQTELRPDSIISPPSARDTGDAWPLRSALAPLARFSPLLAPRPRSHRVQLAGWESELPL